MFKTVSELKLENGYWYIKAIKCIIKVKVNIIIVPKDIIWHLI